MPPTILRSETGRYVVCTVLVVLDVVCYLLHATAYVRSTASMLYLFEFGSGFIFQCIVILSSNKTVIH